MTAETIDAADIRPRTESKLTEAIKTAHCENGIKTQNFTAFVTWDAIPTPFSTACPYVPTILLPCYLPRDHDVANTAGHLLISIADYSCTTL